MPRLSAFDLLMLSEEEQQIIRCLANQPGLAIMEIAKKVDILLPDLEETVKRLVQEGRLVEQLKDEQRIFSVRFKRTNQRVRNISPAILGIFEQSLEAFLFSAPLVSVLDESARQALIAKGETRTLMPGEVCIWQGHQSDHLGLVRIGLLKKSRLRGDQQEAAMTGYVGRSEWFGLSEALSSFPIADTYTAVTESELLLWSASDFFDFVSNQADFSFAISKWVSQQLHQTYEQQSQAQLWAINAISAQEDATMLAANLASLAAQNNNNAQSENLTPVLLWHPHPNSGASHGPNAGHSSRLRANTLPRQTSLQHQEGIDILLGIEYSDYPTEVQLDILLTNFQRRYHYIICDTGTQLQDELILRLRGRAHVAITISQNPNGAETVQEHWNHSKPYTRPGQRRMAILNRRASMQQEVDPAFHLMLPEDSAALIAAELRGLPVVQAAPQSMLSQSLKEVYRRLTLNHTIGIFVPSTMDVDKPIDTLSHVQSTLSFLGGLFGGATRNQAEGAWSSEESGLVVEAVTIVRSFVSERALQSHLDSVIIFVTDLKKELRQEAIAIDVDNQLLLI